MASESDPRAPDAAALARLGVMQRLAMGAAHSLNNAFTTIVAEASFLHADHKQDAAVLEACESILREMDRCTAITRGLLTRRHPSQGGQSELDLGRQVRELGNFLDQVLGRQNELSFSIPDELALIAGNADALELLVLGLVVYAADQSPHGAKLDLGVETTPRGDAWLSLVARARELPEHVADALHEPERAGDPLVRLQLEAIAQLVASFDASLTARRSDAETWQLEIRFPPPP